MRGQKYYVLLLPPRNYIRKSTVTLLPCLIHVLIGPDHPGEWLSLDHSGKGFPHHTGEGVTAAFVRAVINRCCRNGIIYLPNHRKERFLVYVDGNERTFEECRFDFCLMHVVKYSPKDSFWNNLETFRTPKYVKLKEIP